MSFEKFDVFLFIVITTLIMFKYTKLLFKKKAQAYGPELNFKKLLIKLLS